MFLQNIFHCKKDKILSFEDQRAFIMKVQDFRHKLSHHSIKDIEVFIPFILPTAVCIILELNIILITVIIAFASEETTAFAIKNVNNLSAANYSKETVNSK